MRIIRNQKVYDLDYGAYETVCDIPVGGRTNGVGNPERVTRALRKDKRSGLFYLVEECCSAYSRDHYKVIPASEEEARRIAEDYLDYDGYVKFFGDPEGGSSALERERDDAVKARDAAESAREYWFEECRKATEKLAEVQKKVEELVTGKETP